jgi:hypothetical protein
MPDGIPIHETLRPMQAANASRGALSFPRHPPAEPHPNLTLSLGRLRFLVICFPNRVKLSGCLDELE